MLMMVLLSINLRASDYVNVHGALLRPGMTQAEVESALAETGCEVTRNNGGPDAIWSIFGSKTGIQTREYQMDFRGGRLRIVSRSATIQKESEPAPNAAGIVNTLFNLLRGDGADAGRVTFLTTELSQETLRHRTVAFLVGEKIFMLSVVEPVGGSSFVMPTVQIEERMEAKETTLKP